jgi:hypothetical protein
MFKGCIFLFVLDRREAVGKALYSIEIAGCCTLKDVP